MIPLADATEIVHHLLAPCDFEVGSCLTYSNISRFDWPFGKHLLSNLYIPRVCRVEEVTLRRAPKNTLLFVPNGEEAVPVVSGKPIHEQVHPGWSVDDYRSQLQSCRQVARLDQEAILLTRYGMRTWGHWLGEILPKAAIVEERFPNRYEYLIPRALLTDASLSTQRESLRSINIPANRLVVLEERTVYACDGLLLVSSVWSDRSMHPHAIDALRATTPGSYVSAIATERVALLRRESKTRRIANLGEVEKVLCDNGFTPVDLETAPYSEQVCCFRHATNIVSILGSGLTGLIFSPKHVKVITLAPVGWSDDFFYSLMRNRKASLIDLRGLSVPCGQSHIATADFNLDPVELDLAIRLVT